MDLRRLPTFTIEYVAQTDIYLAKTTAGLGVKI